MTTLTTDAAPTPVPRRSSLRPTRLRLLRPHATYDLTIFIFLRLLGLVYAIAFLSLWVQVDGLIGSHGILPVQEFVEHVRAYAVENDQSPVALAPTLCLWFNSDAALHVLCAAGVVLGCSLTLGLLPGPILLLLWLDYLSLAIAGQAFLGFQWENLLLETGLLAIFLAPTTPWLRPGPITPPDAGAPRWIWRGLVAFPRTIARWLLWWLLFRLMLQSGLVKLGSNDEVWWNLTALTYHYWTQPLPTSTSYLFHHLPLWFHKLSVLVTYLIEFLLPLFILGPRLLKRIACAGFILLMVLIGLTGNYTYFNLLTIVLALLLLDDTYWPRRLRNWWSARAHPSRLTQLAHSRLPLFAVPAAAVTLLTLTLATEILPPSWFYLHSTLSRFSAVTHERRHWPLRLPAPEASSTVRARLERWSSCRSVNSYGLFANMTETRPEITLEGSLDGRTWQPYAFRYKPGDPHRAPRFVQPHQPRLDWQMWFAALGTARGNPWLIRLMDHLLRGTPQVLDLLGANPFPQAPPRFVRATVSDYQFTAPTAKRTTGNWWTCGPPRPYTPILTLVDNRLAIAAP